MRILWVPALLGGLVAGCLDASSAPEETPSTVRIRVPQLNSLGGLGCFSVTGVSTDDVTWLTQGTTDPKETRASAMAAGDFCETTTQHAQLVTACPPGQGHELALTLTGLFDADGAAVETAFQSPCTEESPCTLSFDCVEGVETTVDFNLVIMPNSNQGFFDISAALPEEHRFGETCFVFRVVKGEAGGELVSASDIVCSSEYGGGSGATTYIMPCNADAPENTLTVWLERAVFRSGVADPSFVNPCPVPADAATSPVEAWTGGCNVKAACLENQDTPIKYELDATRP